MTSANKGRLARNARILVGSIRRLWGGATEAGIGLVLTEVYYSNNPWVTVSFITSQLTRASDDTVRRRLEELIDAGLAEFIEPDGRKLYKATEKAADGTTILIEDAFAKSNPATGLIAVHRLSATA
jgi:hypothetical protein